MSRLFHGQFLIPRLFHNLKKMYSFVFESIVEIDKGLHYCNRTSSCSCLQRLLRIRFFRLMMHLSKTFWLNYNQFCFHNVTDFYWRKMTSIMFRLIRDIGRNTEAPLMGHLNNRIPRTWHESKNRIKDGFRRVIMCFFISDTTNIWSE